MIYHQDYGGVLREDGFRFEDAEVDVSMGHPGKGGLGTDGSMGLMSSPLPSRTCLTGSLCGNRSERVEGHTKLWDRKGLVLRNPGLAAGFGMSGRGRAYSRKTR